MPPKAKPKAKVGAAAPKAKAGAAPKAKAAAAPPPPLKEEPDVPINMEEVLGVLKPASSNKTTLIDGYEAAIKKAEETLGEIDKKLKKEQEKLSEGVTHDSLNADKAAIEQLLIDIRAGLEDRKEVEQLLKEQKHISVDYVERTAEFYYGVTGGAGAIEDSTEVLLTSAL